MKKSSFYIGLRVQLFILSTIIFLTTILISSYIFHKYSNDIYENEIKNKVKDLTLVSSLEFKDEDLNELLDFSDIEKPEYSITKNKLLNLKKNVDYIKYISIVKKIDSNKAISLIDSSTEPKDINNDGTILPETEGLILLGDMSNEISLSIENGMTEGFKENNISKIKHKNDIGSWIRVYSPIDKSNKYLLLTDIYTNKKEINEDNFIDVIQNAGIMSIFVVVLFVVFYSFTLILPIKKILKTSAEIQKGNFVRLELSPLYGEISKLSDSINYISNELQNSQENSEATKKLIEKKKEIIETTNKQIQQKNYELNSTIMTLNRINEIVEELISIKETDNLMESVLRSTIEIINAEKGFIIKHDEDKKFHVLSLLNTTNIQDEQELKFNEIDCLKKVFETMNYTNIHEEGKFISEEFKNALVFPLIIENEIDGLLFIMNKKSKDGKEVIHFNESDESTVRTLSKLVSAVWESIKLFEMATIDTISKLYVRRYFEKNLDQEIKYSLKDDFEMILLMIDIDNLQKYNNKYGRSSGDKIIEKTAEIIKNIAGEDFLTARYGGDKFVILMLEKTKDDAKELAEKIREQISNFELELDITEGNENIIVKEKVTVSIGISSFIKNAKTAEQFLRNSEIALYKAKQNGKNKVSIL